MARALVVGFLVLAGCGGERSFLPAPLREDLQQIDRDFAAGRTAEACERLGPAYGQLVEWQVTLRGNRVAAAHDLVLRMDGVLMSCSLEDGGEQAAAQWREVGPKLLEVARVKSGWGTVAKWVAILSAALAVGVILRRLRR